MARAHEHERGLEHFARYLENRSFTLEKEMSAVSEAVNACKVLLETGAGVSGARFASFVKPLLGRHPALIAIEWVPRVDHQERAAHQREGRAATGAGYRITERGPGGDLIEAGQRDAYYPVLFAEPFAGNEPAVGFDLGSDGARRDALERALAGGKPTLSDPIDLVQGADAGKGVLLVVPVSSPDASPSDPVGFVCGVLSASTLVDRSFPQGLPEASTLAHVQLVDASSPLRPSVMFSLPEYDHGQGSDAVWGAPIQVGGKLWRLGGHPTGAFLAGSRSGQPMAFALSFLVGWEALVALSLALIWRTHRRRERQQAGLINAVIDGLSEGVVVADRQGRFLFSNHIARAMAGVGSEQVPPEQWSSHFGLYVPGTRTLFPADELPLMRAIRGEQVRETEVVVRDPRSGQDVWLSVDGSPLSGANGGVDGGVVVFRDITARRKAAELVQRLSSAVQQTADAVLITDRAGVIEYVNPAFESITGYPASEVIGQTPRILKSGQQSADYYKQLWATVLAGQPFRGTPVNRKKDGTLFHAEQTITPITNQVGQITHLVSVLRDMTERRRMEEQEIEMRLAASIQRRLFPERPPLVPGWDIAGAASPALATCGDYYDFLTFDNGSLGIVVGDACGHGVGPALIMAQTRSHLRSLARTHGDLTAMLGEIDQALFEDLEDRLYVTMILAFLDTTTGILRWINAGHPSACVLDSAGAVKSTLSSTGLPLGLLPDRPRSNGQQVVLDSGDVALFLTDGVLEASSPDGAEFGAERAVAVVRENRHRPAAEIVRELQSAVHDFTEGRAQEDDVTVVVVRRTGTDAGAPGAATSGA